MSLEKEIQHWMKSEEFLAFFQKAEYAMALVLESKESDFEHVKPHLIEMGRRYNHFLFTVTENLIKKAKNHTTLSTEEIATATKQFVTKLEGHIREEYPIVFSFFLQYRESLYKTMNL